MKKTIIFFLVVFVVIFSGLVFAQDYSVLSSFKQTNVRGFENSFEIGTDILPEISEASTYTTSIWIQFPANVGVKINKIILSSGNYSESEKFEQSFFYNSKENKNLIINKFEFNSSKFIRGNNGRVDILIEVSGRDKNITLKKEVSFAVKDIQKEISKMKTFQVSSIPGGTWFKGDFHVHSNISSIKGGCVLETSNADGYSLSQVKSRMASMGLNFVFVTDHSYCLDSAKFQKEKNEAASLSTGYSFALIMGEELSVKEDCANEVAHLGSGFLTNFISQTPVSWYPTSPGEQQAVNLILGQDGVSIMNHPYDSFWDWKCVNSTKNITGIEIWNGQKADKNAVNLWINNFLLKGKKAYAFFGSDSHEPDLSPTGNYIGAAYNMVYAISIKNQNDLKDAIKKGHVYVSNDGYMTMNALYGGQNYMIGDSFKALKGKNIEIDFSYNLDHLCSLRLCKGSTGALNETCVSLGPMSGIGAKGYVETLTKSVYYRADCIGSGNYSIYMNPIWVDVS